MKKRLNIDMVANELKGQSAFFPGYQKPAPPSAEAADATIPPPTVAAAGQLPATARERPNARTPERPFGKRIITRNSFEIYEDQMDALRELSYREKKAGKLGSMSAMVREAIDTFIKRRSSP